MRHGLSTLHNQYLLIIEGHADEREPRIWDVVSIHLGDGEDQDIPAAESAAIAYAKMELGTGQHVITVFDECWTFRGTFSISVKRATGYVAASYRLEDK